MTNLQIINSLLNFLTIPFAIHLFILLMRKENHHADTVKYVLLGLSLTIIVTMAISLNINYKLLIGGVSASDILYEANIRNLIKNITLLITTITFWHIARERG